MLKKLVCNLHGLIKNAIEMKRLSIILLLTLGVHLSAMSEKHFDLGFTTSISYTDYFTLALEPTIGYEFNDFFAMGTVLAWDIIHR